MFGPARLAHRAWRRPRLRSVALLTVLTVGAFCAAPVGAALAADADPHLVMTFTPGSVAVGDTYTVNATSDNMATITFTGNANCTISSPSDTSATVTFVHAGTCSVSAHQDAVAGSYLAGDDGPDDVTVDKADQTITFAAPPSAAAGTTYTAAPTSDSGLTVALTSATMSKCTVSGFTVTYKAVGTCTLHADQSGNTDYNAAPQVPHDVTVTMGTSTITFDAPVTGAVGTSVTLSATGQALSSSPVVLTSDSESICTVTNPAHQVSYLNVGSCSITATQAADANFSAAAPVNDTVDVRNPQVITFTSTPPDPALIGATYTATAVGGASGNAVTFAGSGACSSSGINGATITFNSAGPCTITANQLGNLSYFAADPKTQTISVVTAAVTFTSSAPSAAQVGGTTYAPTTSGTGSTAPVVLTVDASAAGVCAISGGGVVSFIDVGTCVIDANQAADGTHAASPQVQQSFAVGKGTQTITFTSTAPSPGTVGSTYAVTTSNSSGLAVTLSIEASSSGVCTISGTTVTFSANGSCVIDANAAGSSKYEAATQRQQTVTVGKTPQTITFTSTAPTAGQVGQHYTPTASASSQLAPVLSIAPASTNVCSIASGVVTLNAAGTCTVLANQAGNATFAAAPTASQSFGVTNPIGARPVLSQTSEHGIAVLTTVVDPRFEGKDVIFFVRSGITGVVRPLGRVKVNASGQAVRVLTLQTGQILRIYCKLLAGPVVNPYSNDVAFKVK